MPAGPDRPGRTAPARPDSTRPPRPGLARPARAARPARRSRRRSEEEGATAFRGRRSAEEGAAGPNRCPRARGAPQSVPPAAEVTGDKVDIMYICIDTYMYI